MYLTYERTNWPLNKFASQSIKVRQAFRKVLNPHSFYACGINCKLLVCAPKQSILRKGGKNEM